MWKLVLAITLFCVVPMIAAVVIVHLLLTPRGCANHIKRVARCSACRDRAR